MVNCLSTYLLGDLSESPPDSMTALSDKLESQQERKPNSRSNNGRQDEVKERLK
ncbi:hypothetical protein LguiB_022424 [Lonicera macranthoides]